MKINIELDDELLAKAQEVSGIQDINALIEKALEVFISLEHQQLL